MKDHCVIIMSGHEPENETLRRYPRDSMSCESLARVRGDLQDDLDMGWVIVLPMSSISRLELEEEPAVVTYGVCPGDSPGSETTEQRDQWRESTAQMHAEEPRLWARRVR